MNRNKIRLYFILFCISLLALTACKAENNNSIKPYGVFLNANEIMDEMADYRILVIDAQNFSGEEIRILKNVGHIVYSYVNVGSLETFRPYYDEYKDLTLAPYEHWEDECWVDICDERWSEFVLRSLLPELDEKGVDGYFFDNFDVYYMYQTEEVYAALTNILTEAKATGKYVIVNGGDTYVQEYYRRNSRLDAVLDAVNQESVFSAIDWNSGVGTEQSEDDYEYFTEYLELVNSLGIDVYIIDYAKDKALINGADKYCEEHGYVIYHADSIGL